MNFAGANNVAPTGVDQSATSFNYLIGDASQHRSNVSGFQKILYSNLYNGIDLQTWGRADGMNVADAEVVAVTASAA